MDDEAAMDLALGEATRALAHGDVPVGAVVLVDGQVVACRHNERELQSDPTAHAEVLALRDAATVVADGWRLENATLVVTLEPCPMCAGAALAARISRLVFAAADLRGGACGSVYNMCTDPRLGHEIDLRIGVRAPEAAALLAAFFGDLRGSGSTDVQ